MGARAFLLGLALVVGCSDGAPPCGPNDIDCAETGEACTYSINCPLGNICNARGGEGFDERLPTQICVQLSCTADAECVAPRVCQVDGLCAERPCQADDICAAPLVCLGGRCAAPPTPTLDGCELTTLGRVLAPGERAVLSAVGVLADGTLSPWMSFGYRSDHPEIVAIADGAAIATGGLGAAVITATAAGVQCRATFSVVAPPVPERLQIIAVREEDEAPISAEIGLWVERAWKQGRRDLLGVVGSTEAVDAVSARAPDREPLLIVAPGRGTVVVALRRAPRDDQVSGVRGRIDFSQAIGAGDVRLGIVGGLLDPAPADMLNALHRSFCQLHPTELRLPGVVDESPNAVSPSVVVGVGLAQLTTDRRGCAPSSDGHVGCFVSLGQGRPSAAWAVGGLVRVSGVAALARELFVGEGACVTSGAALFRLGQRYGSHAAVPVLELSSAPLSGGVECGSSDELDRCQPDPLAFEARDLKLDTPRSVLSLIRVPPLPALSTPAVVVSVSAKLPHRGLIPLGFGLGRLPAGAREGLIEPNQVYFRSEPPGSLALSVAPRHAGLEGAPLVITALAISGDETSPASRQESSLISKPAAVVGDTERFAQPFLPLPSGTYSRSARTLRLVGAEGEGMVRARFSRAGQHLTVLLPRAQETVLPDLPELSLLSGSGGRLLISVLSAGQPYAGFLARGSSGHYTRLYERDELQVASRACREGPDEPCRLLP